MIQNKRRNVYRYKLINSYRQLGAKLDWIRIWVKQSVKNYKYRYYPIILTISGKCGEFIEKRFKSFDDLKTYLTAGQLA